MTAATKQNSNSTAAIVFAVFAVVCVVAFLWFRGSDVGQLPRLVGNLGGGSLFGNSIVYSFYGVAVAALILYSWFSLGTLIGQFLGITVEFEVSPARTVATGITVGAAGWSLIWFGLGSLGLFNSTVAIVCVVVAIFNGCYVFMVVPFKWPNLFAAAKIPGLALVGLPVLLSLVSALAPPIAKDSLLYHFALPKAFVAQHSNTFVDGNIASYLALGTEIQYGWARLLGGIFDPQAAEAAAGATSFLYFPLLIIVAYGWARELGLSQKGGVTVGALVASIPSAYHVASSGYIDLSLALYVMLATYALTRWWKEQTWGRAVLIAIFLGAALSVKLTAVFVFAAFSLVILLRARGNQSAGKVVGLGFASLLLAGVIASPWYIRTWVATGSPVFPFYMSIWPGRANGWDVERSNLFQAMNSQYGGADTNKLNLVTAPVRVSVAAQPEQPANYDGVLGPAFLIGLPLLVYALWKLDLAVEIEIIAGVAAVMYLFWLFSSEQLRYLLPIVPMLAIAIAAAAEKIGGSVAKVAKCALITASVCGLITIFAWFCQKSPLRVVLGGESRDAYLTRSLDYYPYYQEINTNAPADAKVWLINMRRDTYNIERPVVSDYLFEDWTLRKMLWESRSSQELKAKAASLGVQYILTRHDFLFDYDRSTLVDDKRPRAENEAKLRMARELILDPARAVKADDKFSLVKLY